MKDLFGQAILDYFTKNQPEDLFTETSISEEDIMEVSYLFRSYEQMPKIEQLALDLCTGKTLDIGCGAGSHSLYLQKEKAIDVTALDISEKALTTCRARGIKSTILCDILDLEETTKYDTLLLLMNGTGIFKTLHDAPFYLNKLKKIMTKTGQILIDSSDIIYMFDEDEDGGRWIPGMHYYGELNFTLKYKNQTEDPFPWLYLDFETLKELAKTCGLSCDLVASGNHYDYLACLQIE